MDSNLRIVLVPFAIVATLCSCNDPYQLSVPPDPKGWAENQKFIDGIKKLPDDEKKLVLAYGLRAGMASAFGGSGIPPGETVKGVIEAQRKWEDEMKRAEAERAALKAKVEAEQRDRLNAMNSVLTIAVTELAYRKVDYSDFISIKIAFENKTDRGLAGVKGTVVFADMFGDLIKKVNLSYDEGVPARGTKTWAGQIDFNQFMDEDKKLATTPLEKLRVRWEPKVFLFTDGSSLLMPEGG